MVKLEMMRKKRRLTQQQLASMSGVTQQAISKIEQGERKSPQISTLHKLALALKCTVDDLIESEDEGRSA